MKNFITIFKLLLLGSVFCACQNDDAQLPPLVEEGQIVYSVSDEFVDVANIGQTVEVTFVTFGKWVVSNEAEWCVLDKEHASGGVGDGRIVIKVLPNPDDEVIRSDKIWISIEGQPKQLLCTVTQDKQFNQGQPAGRDVNKWISQHMQNYYLWNDNFLEIKNMLNFNAEPNAFLQSALQRMTRNDQDGGVLENGERYYYSNITEFQLSTRLSQANNYGINQVYTVQATQSSYYLLVASVYPDSPADQAGMKRGMYITSYNGSPINSYNLEEAFYAVMGYSTPLSVLNVQMAEYQETGDGNYTLKDIGSKVVTPTTYSKNPIIYTGLYASKSNDRKIGYLVYSDFDAGADVELLKAFERLKSNGANELILDLRYNGGGDVISSAMMATAIVGNKHKGEVYSEMEFNEYRKAKGEQEFFYIGEDPSMHKYPLMQDALAQSLDLGRVYVITSGLTASASELVINGLRGLGVDVFVVGDKTEGKNVGMEVVLSNEEVYSNYDFGNYAYYFAAITFYNKNALGFKEYSNGFAPDFTYYETKDILFDWDSQPQYDACRYACIEHIITGGWPNFDTKTRSAADLSNTLEVDLNNQIKVPAKNAIVMPAEYYNNIIK